MFKRPSGTPVPFHGSIIDDQGNVVYQAVSGTIFVEKAGEKSSWSGNLIIDSGEQPTFFSGRLVVNDKRGHVRAFAIGHNIKFAGSGECPV